MIVRRMSTTSAYTESKSLNYCINLLQKRAYEQYIATLLLPPNIRRCGFAIRAFNVEISSIRDQVSARNVGLGRTVFWQELVHKLFERGSHIPNHPVAKELSYVIQNVSLFILSYFFLQHLKKKEIFYFSIRYLKNFFKG